MCLILGCKHVVLLKLVNPFEGGRKLRCRVCMWKRYWGPGLFLSPFVLSRHHELNVSAPLQAQCHQALSSHRPLNNGTFWFWTDIQKCESNDYFIMGFCHSSEWLTSSCPILFWLPVLGSNTGPCPCSIHVIALSYITNTVASFLFCHCF